MSARKIATLFVSAAISIALIAYLSSRVEADDIVRTFSRIHYPALFLFMTISLLTAALRALRYQWLLHPSRIGFKNIFLVTLIRNLFVDLLPARIGSLSYVYLLNKRLKYPFEEAASTFVVAFVFDFLTLSPFVVLSILIVGPGSSSVTGPLFLGTALIFFLLIALIVWKIIPLSRLALKVYKALLQLLHMDSKDWALNSADKLQTTITTLDQIQKRKIQWPLFFLSLLLRLGKYGSLYVLLFALLHSHGLSFENLSFWKTILGITGGEMTGALPIKGLAGFGTWESGWAVAFRLMKFDPRLSILSGIGVHLITNLYEYALGIFSIMILAFPFVVRKKHKSK
ncbi:MAG: flippase-like domain-containing protein [Candidatus Aminicenantes bacterium]|nr:flippase-like domain-containing protein [Candidatus Aminicenantes bacterium]